MIELVQADDFIKRFEKLHKLKIHKIPLNFASGRSVLLLMCRCGREWIALPHCSECYVQTDISALSSKPPFIFVESQDGNLFCSKHIRWQIRDTRAWSNNIYAEKLNFSIPLGEEEPMNALSSNIRRKIRKANSLGVTIKRGGRELIRDFYKVYSQRMYDLGSPAFGKGYLRKMASQGGNIIFVAYFEGKPIGGATLSKREDNSYENGLFSTDTHFNHLYTSYALHNEMMIYAQSQGASRYWLGRSTRASSVHQYKRHFKPEETDLFWSYSVPTKNIRNKTYLRRLWRLLPFPLANFLGGLISPRIY